MTRTRLTMRRWRPMVSAALLLGLTACMMADHTRSVEIKSVLKQSELQLNDAYYESAVTAINQRDYGRALDLLQIAREHKSDDVRVLNAFGVVYDELGRIDLSARYYAEAKAIDQTSTILANNMAQSDRMQALLIAASQTPLPTDTVQIAAPPAKARVMAGLDPVIVRDPRASEQQALEQPGVIRIALTTPPVMVLPVQQTADASLVLVNAAGHNDGPQMVRSGLLQLGWAVSNTSAVEAMPVATTKIVYAADQDAEARKLARTLLHKPKLVECDQTCAGLRLIVGMDSSEWMFSGRFAPRHTDENYAIFGRTLRTRLG